MDSNLTSPITQNIQDTSPFGGEEPTNQHPWRLSREECVFGFLKGKKLQNLADIGVNDMYYTKRLKSFSETGNVYAVDVFFPEEGTVKHGIKCINDISKLPENEIDCAIMMDVLEHIEDDSSFFKTIVAKLKPGATILITVPAFQFLFSAHDKKHLHFRRYNRKQLLKVLKQDFVEIERCHYFYTSLFLIRLLMCLKKKKFDGNDTKNWKYDEKHIITVIFKKLLSLDFTINKILNTFSIHLPGLSLLAVCKKTQ